MLLFDLDGTLLSSNGMLSNTISNTFLMCKKAGYKIGILTARSRTQKNINLVSCIPYDYISFYNGAQNYAANTLIISHLLTFQKTIPMLQRLYSDFPDLTIDVYQEPWQFSTKNDEIYHMETCKKQKCNLKELPKHDIQRIRLRSQSILTIPLISYMTSESNFYYTAQGDAIIVHKNANKGCATQYASEFFQIPTTSIIAFGDDMNDIDMLEKVGTSVAVKNAVSELKKLATYFADSNDNNGVECWILENLLKSKEYI